VEKVSLVMSVFFLAFSKGGAIKTIFGTDPTALIGVVVVSACENDGEVGDWIIDFDFGSILSLSVSL
jgi:hypothetical protein